MRAAYSTYQMLNIEGVGSEVGISIAERLRDCTADPELKAHFAGVVEHYRAHPVPGLPLL